MDELREKALAAKTDEGQFDELVRGQKQWILRVASECVHRYVTDSDDEWSVALLAFHEAVQTYDTEKGSFRALASVVIRRRILDYLRSEGRHSAEISVMPGAFDGELDEEEAAGVNLQVQQQVAQDAADESAEEERGANARDEIEAVQKLLGQYDFSFYDLTDCSPKADKTRKSCAAAVGTLLQNEELLAQMRRNRALPMKMLSAESGISRKILDRHRKYIIAAAEILSGDFPSLKPYMSFITNYLRETSPAPEAQE